MNASPRRNRKTRITGTILLALLLTITLLPAAALAAPPPLDGDPPPTDQNKQQSQNPPPSSDNPPPHQSQNPPPHQSQNPPPHQSQNPPPQQSQNPPPTTDQPPPTTNTAHPDAPSTPSSGCVVAHAATPAQLCPVAGGLQYYFIGKDGSTSIGPFISPFADLAALYTVGTAVRLYTGSNPLTGKSVHIDYLPADRVIRVSTYYPDTQYDTDKPYTFTVNGSNAVSHIAW